MITDKINEFEILESGITSPKGFKALGENVGIKKVKKDLAIIYSEVKANCSAVFTQNIVIAPPLEWCKKILKEKNKIQAIAINSGNANACTGKKGYDDAVKIAETVAETLNTDKNSVMVTSTGVIGVFLPMDKIINGIKAAAPKLSSSDIAAKDCAYGIMTTDTFPKEISVKIELSGKPVIISGIAKGSGMIHPNMATMLCFITTDANISQNLLDMAFKGVISDSFNMISVDGEMSTNDMAVVLANGKAENKLIDTKNEDYEKFSNALDFVVKDLAKKIVLDGEGASKFLEVSVCGAKTKEDARVLCQSVINSNLVKAAFFGEDANWGRIISAMGASGAKFNPQEVRISFENTQDKIILYENGLPVDFSEELASKILKEKQINILIELNEGDGKITGWGCDLTYDYVKINADYRS